MILFHYVFILSNIQLFVRTGCENMCGIAPQCDDKNVIQKDNVGDKRCIVNEGGSLENEMNESML